MPYNIQFPLVLRKYSKGTDIFISSFQPLKIFNDEIWILSKLDEEILISFDSFELPIITLEDEVKIDLRIAG
jgi:hypothetical protein